MVNISPSASGRDRDKSGLEVADIFRDYGTEYQREHWPTFEQRRVIKDIIRCRTPEMGGHVDACQGGCGYYQVFYNSCRNRHCPKCQGVSRARWLAGRMEKVLPTHYFHMVVTLPHELGPLALGNKRLIYTLLFKAASKAILELAQGYDRLKAKVGFTAVLHTWNQDLLFHPHVHLVVTGGGLALDGQKWVAAKNSFLVPVKAVSKIVRGKFLEMLAENHEQGELRFGKALADLKEKTAFRRLVKKLRKKKWVVYCKRPFRGAEQVYSYVSQYTHRVAISNYRLVDLTDGRVTFKARDNDSPGNHRLVTIEAVEFIRRFLLHVLPKGFVRIRHYGLLAPKNVNTRLQTARTLLLEEHCPDETGPSTEDKPRSNRTWQDILFDLSGINLKTCPQCGRRLVRRPINKGDIMLLLETGPIAA